MSVLVQRPHQIPGIISLQRQHPKPSPRRQPQPVVLRNNQPTVSPVVLSQKVSRRQRGHQAPSTCPDSPSPANTQQARSNNTVNKRRSNVPSAASDATPAQSISFPSSVSSSQTVLAPSTATGNATIPTAPATPPQVHTTAPAILPSPRRNVRPTQSAPTTPIPVQALPVPANRRRARSPRPTAKLPPVLSTADEVTDIVPEDDMFAPTLAGQQATPAKRARRNAPGSISLPVPDSPANWQQAALIKKSHAAGVHTTGTLTPVLDPLNVVALPSTAMSNAVKSGSASTPTSPARPIANPHFVGNGTLAHSPTMPNFPFFHPAPINRRPAGHTRAPSVPSFPVFANAMTAEPSLDSLFSTALVLDSAPSTPNPQLRGHGHVRGASMTVSSSLPHPSMLQSAARRERTLTGPFTDPKAGKFAGASFQTAPDAMVLPKPNFLGGRFGMFTMGSPMTSSSSEAEDEDESEESDVVDLGEESEDEVVFLL